MGLALPVYVHCCRESLGPVVRRMDNFIQRINPYPADKIGAFLIFIGQQENFIHKKLSEKVVYS